MRKNKTNFKSLDYLASVIRRPTTDFPGDKCNVPDGRGVLIHRDNGADVLAVAHLDSVMDGKLEVRGDIVRHPALDDRLGVWAWENLIADGLKVDLLLTDCEEIGWSTASDFVSPKPYKFTVSLDRYGSDAVLYQYSGAKRWSRHAGQYFDTSHGSYSCVADLDHLGVCGINIGVGYYEHNTSRCWADLNLTRAQMRRTANFVNATRHRTWGWDAPKSRKPSGSIGRSLVYRNDAWQRFDPWDDFLNRDDRGTSYASRDPGRRETMGRLGPVLCSGCGDPWDDENDALACCAGEFAGWRRGEGGKLVHGLN